MTRPGGEAFESLRAMLNGLCGSGSALWPGLSGEQAAWLRKEGLAPFAFHRLEHEGRLSQLPTAVQDELRTAYYNAAGDAALRDDELRTTLRALAAAGVVPIVYKGAALAYTVYPDPICRPMGDLDLWVAPEEMPKAQAGLAALGYVRHDKRERPPALAERSGGEVQMVSSRPGTGLVELHWSAFGGEWLRRAAAVDEIAIRTRAAVLALDGCSALVMAPEDGIIQLAAHLAIGHHLTFPSLRGLLDIVLLARERQVDWATVVARAKQWRLSTLCWLVLTLADGLWGLDEAAPAMAQLAPGSWRQKILLRLAGPWTLLTGRDSWYGERRFVLHLLLVDRAGDGLRLVGRAVWPTSEWLAARYGRNGPGVRRRHLLSALRGRL